MSEHRDTLERELDRLSPSRITFDRLARRRDRKRRDQKIRAGVLGLAIAIAVGWLGINAIRSTPPIPAGQPTTTTEAEQPARTPPVGFMDPGRYTIRTLDHDFDASHRITVDVPAGYRNFGGWAFLKGGLNETGVSTWVVNRVFADGCKWDESALEGSPDASTGGLAAVLADQKGFRVSTPLDVSVDGYASTYMKRTLHSGTNLDRCIGKRFMVWVSKGNGNRYLQFPGQQDLLWILDVDGVPLVIDAPVDAEASAEDRAEIVEMVESIRIDPR